MLSWYDKVHSCLCDRSKSICLIYFPDLKKQVRYDVLSGEGCGPNEHDLSFSLSSAESNTLAAVCASLVSGLPVTSTVHPWVVP